MPRSFSLPTQRCFRPVLLQHPELRLFSAYAEVFLKIALKDGVDIPFLCLRRGVSGVIDRSKKKGAFSLPTQRCFYQQIAMSAADALFSAYAEVFLNSRG